MKNFEEKRAANFFYTHKKMMLHAAYKKVYENAENTLQELHEKIARLEALVKVARESEYDLDKFGAACNALERFLYQSPEKNIEESSRDDTPPREGAAATPKNYFKPIDPNKFEALFMDYEGERIQVAPAIREFITETLIWVPGGYKGNFLSEYWHVDGKREPGFLLQKWCSDYLPTWVQQHHPEYSRFKLDKKSYMRYINTFYRIKKGYTNISVWRNLIPKYCCLMNVDTTEVNLVLAPFSNFRLSLKTPKEVSQHMRLYLLNVRKHMGSNTQMMVHDDFLFERLKKPPHSPLCTELYNRCMRNGCYSERDPPDIVEFDTRIVTKCCWCLQKKTCGHAIRRTTGSLPQDLEVHALCAARCAKQAFAYIELYKAIHEYAQKFVDDQDFYQIYQHLERLVRDLLKHLDHDTAQTTKRRKL